MALSDTINVGVADMIFTPHSTGIPIYLGLTKGGVVAKYEEKYHEVTADQTGETPLEDVLIGQTLKIEAKLLDTSLEKINKVCIASHKEGDIDAVTFGERPGLRVTHRAGKLVVHPISSGAGDLTKDLIVYKTAHTGGIEMAYKLDEEWVIPGVFKAYYADDRPEGDQLFRIGLEDPNYKPNKKVVKFWIAPSNPTIRVGNTTDFTANAMYEDGTTEDVTDRCTWLIADPTIASLGALTTRQPAQGVAVGSTIIRASYIGYSNSTTIVVK